VSEQILNGTSAQLSHTVPFTLVHATKNISKTKLAWFSCLLRHSAKKRGGLILQCSRAHTNDNNRIIIITSTLRTLKTTWKYFHDDALWYWRAFHTS